MAGIGVTGSASSRTNHISDKMKAARLLVSLLQGSGFTKFRICLNLTNWDSSFTHGFPHGRCVMPREAQESHVPKALFTQIDRPEKLHKVLKQEAKEYDCLSCRLTGKIP